jgi:hypothetical protein
MTKFEEVLCTANEAHTSGGRRGGASRSDAAEQLGGLQ